MEEYCIKRLLAILVALAMCCLCYTFGYIQNPRNCISITDRNEVDFFRAFLYAIPDTAHVPLDMLVPVEWERVKVFRAYATPENKVKYAGYQYADDLDSIEYEDTLSLVFMNNSYVVFYVDILLPRMFKYEYLDNGLVRMSLKGRYSVDIDEEMVPTFSEWALHPQIDEVLREHNPYFEVNYKSDGQISLVLDCE